MKGNWEKIRALSGLTWSDGNHVHWPTGREDVMAKFLICVHHFEAPSVYLLHQHMAEQEYGKLYAAVEIAAATMELAEHLRSKARGDTFNKFGLAYPEKITDVEDYPIFRFSPFLKRQKVAFSEYDRFVYRGINEFDSYTRVDDGWELQDAETSILTFDQAVEQWGNIEVAAARRRYETWTTSDDAKSDRPENHECYFLRECEETASFLPDSVEPLPIQDGKENTDTVSLETEVVPTIDRDAAMKAVSDRLLAYARGIEIIVETFRTTGKNFKYANLVRQLVAEGWVQDSKELYKEINTQKDLRNLREIIAQCPKNRTGSQFFDWQYDFDLQAKFYFERLVHGDREGMTLEESLNEYCKKKAMLVKF